MAKSRQLSIYEKNQLLKYGLKEIDLINQGELPVEYLTGFVDFKDLTIKVNQNVLIPRVETEELVDLMTDSVSLNLKTISYLEIGTGSGAISLAFFDYLRRQKSLQQKKQQKNFLLKNLILTDVSITALTLAKENFLSLFNQELFPEVKFLQSNLLDQFSQDKFNIIVANLPYIPSQKINDLEKSVKDYEPLLALDGGRTGFELINKMLLQILHKNLLIKGGRIFLEVDQTHDLVFVQTYFPEIEENFFIQEFKDQFARQRFLVLQKR